MTLTAISWAIAEEAHIAKTKLKATIEMMVTFFIVLLPPL
jgi:hypothetical protein